MKLKRTRLYQNDSTEEVYEVPFAFYLEDVITLEVANKLLCSDLKREPGTVVQLSFPHDTVLIEEDDFDRLNDDHTKAVNEAQKRNYNVLN